MALISVLLSGIWFLIALAIAVFLVWKLGRLLLGLVLNTILGFLTFFVINVIFNLGLQWDLGSIIITAIFGLPGAAVLVLLKVLGISV